MTSFIIQGYNFLQKDIVFVLSIEWLRFEGVLLGTFGRKKKQHRRGIASGCGAEWLNCVRLTSRIPCGRR